MLTIIDNPYNLDAEDFFVEGKRENNSEREQIIISKVTGRYMSVAPWVVQKAGRTLALMRIDEDLVKDYWEQDTYMTKVPAFNTLVIGLCDASVGLGMGVATMLDGCRYISTTRNTFTTVTELLNFDEKHSHIPNHKLYDTQFDLFDFEKLVIVEDEITTGNTLLNLLRAFKYKFKGSVCDILTVLDNRNEIDEENFNKEVKNLPFKVKVSYLFKSKSTDEGINVSSIPVCESKYDYDCEELYLSTFPRTFVKSFQVTSYPITGTGTFGLSSADIKELDFLAYLAAKKIDESIKELECETILVVGSLENSFVPSRIAHSLEEFDYLVEYNTFVANKISAPESCANYCFDASINGKRKYLYTNVDLSVYDMVIGICDTEPMPKLCDNFLCCAL